MISSFHLQVKDLEKKSSCCFAIFSHSLKEAVLHLCLIPDPERTSSAVGGQLLQIRSLDSSGWEEISRQTSCMKQGQLWSQTRLLRAFSSQDFNLSNFSVVTLLPLVCHPVHPQGCHSVHLNTSYSLGWASPIPSASSQSMCSGLWLLQWQFKKLTPCLPCIWVRSEAGNLSKYRRMCIYAYFVH